MTLVCGACDGTSSVHGLAVGQLAEEGERDYRAVIDSLATVAAPMPSRLELLACIEAEPPVETRTALIDVLLAAEKQFASEGAVRAKTIEVVRSNLFSRDLQLLDAALEASRVLLDPSLREDIVRVLETHIANPRVVDVGLCALSFMSEDFDPEVDDLLIRMIHLGGWVAYEAVFVLVAYMDSDRASVMSALGTAADSADHDTRQLARIGLAKRGRAEFASDVSRALTQPLSELSIDMFQAAQALGLPEFCEQLKEILRQRELRSSVTDPNPAVPLFHIHEAIAACCQD